MVQVTTPPVSGWKFVWLGGRDSNPDSQIQSLESYHWTTSQQRNRIYVSQPIKSTVRHFAFLTLIARMISCDAESESGAKKSLRWRQSERKIGDE